MYNRFMEKYPDDPESMLNLGISYFEKNKLIKAIEILTELATKHKSYTPMATCQLSKIYHKNGQLNKAFEFAKKAALLDIKSPEIFIQYGKISLDMGNVDKAIDCFNRVLSLSPENRYASILLDSAKKKYEDKYGYSYD